jgi:hypothetical protein
MWRPDNWINPYTHVIGTTLHSGDIRAPSPTEKPFYDIYEAGSDAMLKALREMGGSYTEYDMSTSPPGEKTGTLVIIPDEVKE